MFRNLWRKIVGGFLDFFYRRDIEALPDVPIPEGEDGRIAAIHGLNLLDKPSEERFDRITRVAAATLDMPISFITIVDEDRNWYKSCYGVDIQEVDRKISFCTFAIMQDEVYEVEDARKHPRFKNFPVVKHAPFIRYYAGYPISTVDGYHVGTLCLHDYHPRKLTQEERGLLKDLANWAALEINNEQTSRLLEERKKLTKELKKHQEELEDLVEQRTEKLEEALKKAEALKELRDRIIRVMSHQLRTPLNSMRWNLEGLLSNQLGKLKKGQEEFVRIVYESTSIVINRLHDLLKTLDIEQNNVLVKMDAVDIYSIFKTVQGSLKKECELKEMKIVLDNKKKDFPQVYADAEKISVIFERLLFNACSYSEGKKDIHVKFTHQKTGHLKVEIKDKGVGIPKPEQENVFTRFFRASNAHTMQPDGSGLGLYVASKYVEMMNGKMGFSSQEGKGSTFWFKLPVYKEDKHG